MILQRGFAAIVVTTLALGAGANTAIFPSLCRLCCSCWSRSAHAIFPLTERRASIHWFGCVPSERVQELSHRASAHDGLSAGKKLLCRRSLGLPVLSQLF